MSEENQDSFVRQRRNLIAVSIVLFVAQLYDVTIPKINLLGNEFILQLPYHVASILWVPGIYWFIRYLQVLNDRGNLGFIDSVRLRLMEPLRNMGLQKYIANQVKEGGLTIQELKQRKYSITHAEGPYPAYGGFRVDLKIGWTWQREDGATASQMMEPVQIDLPHSEIRYAEAKAWLEVLLYTTKFSEYVLPVLLFLIPVGQVILRNSG